MRTRGIHEITSKQAGVAPPTRMHRSGALSRRQGIPVSESLIIQRKKGTISGQLPANGPAKKPWSQDNGPITQRARPPSEDNDLTTAQPANSP